MGVGTRRAEKGESEGLLSSEVHPPNANGLPGLHESRFLKCPVYMIPASNNLQLTGTSRLGKERLRWPTVNGRFGEEKKT